MSEKILTAITANGVEYKIDGATPQPTGTTATADSKQYVYCGDITDKTNVVSQILNNSKGASSYALAVTSWGKYQNNGSRLLYFDMATSTTAGMMSADMYNKLMNLNSGDTATKVTWDSNSDMDDYIAAGVYDITGTRESRYDNLPITNIGENATISARLIVTVTPEGATTYRHSIGQTLILSNAEGKETKVYTRNGNRTIPTGGASYTITWSNWKCLQGMVESYINTNTIGITTASEQTTGLNGMTENGMYSGIYTDDYTLQAPTFVETFVLVVINDYAVSSQAGTPRRISQLKYATDTLTGQCTVKKRVGTGSDSISWSDWEEIGGGSSEVDITDAVKSYGLLALISQGLAKEGVTYIAKLNANDIGTKLDTEGKIQLHVSQNGDGGGDTVDLVIKVRNNSTIGLVVEINAALTNEKFYKYVYYYNSGKVQVSADMTEL